MHLQNVIIPTRGTQNAYDIDIQDGVVQSVRDTSRSLSSPKNLLLPPLCHPHIHLDKAYLLTSNLQKSQDLPTLADYSDLAPETGSFSEALANTSKAKARYTAPDLRTRGAQLLATSRRQGVTAARAFVEVDHVTGLQALEQGAALRAEFRGLVDVQLCAFAQDPLFSGPRGGTNRRLLLQGLAAHAGSIGALGTTPYVEDTREASCANIRWAVQTALQFGLHLDFHLDYSLEPPEGDQRPLIEEVLRCLQEQDWNGNAKTDRTIVLGHCTQLTRLSSAEWESLASRIKSSGLPISFVGLPTSDIFMMGRPSPSPPPPPPPPPPPALPPPGQAQGSQGRDEPHARPRGTLQVPAMVRDLGLAGCLGVNNVGNAFTPFGSGDPLQLASWGVGLYQAGTPADAELLYGCVSWRARQAIGLGLGWEHGPGREGGGGGRGGGILEDTKMDLRVGSRPGPMLLVRNEEHVKFPGLRHHVPARQRLAIKDVVWDPPEVSLRHVVDESTWDLEQMALRPT